MLMIIFIIHFTAVRQLITPCHFSHQVVVIMGICHLGDLSQATSPRPPISVSPCPSCVLARSGWRRKVRKKKNIEAGLAAQKQIRQEARKGDGSCVTQEDTYMQDFTMSIQPHDQRQEGWGCSVTHILVHAYIHPSIRTHVYVHTHLAPRLHWWMQVPVHSQGPVCVNFRLRHWRTEDGNGYSMLLRLLVYH